MLSWEVYGEGGVFKYLKDLAERRRSWFFWCNFGGVIAVALGVGGKVD